MTGIRNKSLSAFTLIELLVVIMIIMVLASVVIFSLYGVIGNAKVARTQTQIAKLNELIMYRWESYRTKKVRIDPAVAATQTPAQTRQMRLNMIREHMRMELPDRVTDVQDNPAVLLHRPALSSAYLAKAVSGWTWTHQGSECLVMIISQIQDGDSDGREFFFPSEFGDIDGDGMPEIWDAFGRPIEFLRWAPGFQSQIQTLDTTNQANLDPFDPHLAFGDKNPRLHPLIFSAGKDERYDIVVGIGNDAGDQDLTNYATTTPPNNPYYEPSGKPKIGTQMDADGDGEIGWIDNLTNHFQEVKSADD